MIIDYGFSITGKSHINSGTCCQDSHGIKYLENGWVIAAVADGVGSAKNSHIGSRLAVDTVLKFCEECMPWDYSVICIKSMLRTAFNYAFKRIIRESEKTGEPIESYDTTLTMVIYDGCHIIYGHSGDGAIIGLTTFGDYVQITQPQKGVDGISVLPLRSGYTQWKIDTYDEDLVSVLLLTDGMLETLCPYLLRNSVNRQLQVYTPLGAFFADPNGFELGNAEKDKAQIELFLTAEEDYKSELFYTRLSKIYEKHVPNDIKALINEFRQFDYPIKLMQNQQDDKTVVGIINTDVLLDEKDYDFYSEPDWASLQEEWNKKAYPHLYSKNDKCIDKESKKETVYDQNDNISSIPEQTESDDALVMLQRRNQELANGSDVKYISDSNIYDKSNESSSNLPEKITLSDMPKHGKPKKSLKNIFGLQKNNE